MNRVDFACVAAVSLAFISAAAETPRIVSTVDVPLPRELSRAQDIRFEEDGALLISSGAAGVRRLQWENGGDVAVTPLGPRADDCLSVYSSRLGYGGGTIAVAAPFHELAWTNLERAQECGSAHDAGEFNFIGDLDTNGRQLLLIGARREHGSDLLCPDGAIAWLFDLSAGLRRKQTVFTLEPGAVAMNSCGMFEVSVVRFLAGGRFVVVPGVVDGVHLYRGDGSLVRSWDAKTLGFDAACELTAREVELYSSDFEFRHLAWINARRIVDDVVPIGDDFGLVIREVTRAGPSWKLVIVPREGGRPHSLPLALGPGEDLLAHVRADTLGNQIALLVLQYARGSTVLPRLVVKEMEW